MSARWTLQPGDPQPPALLVGANTAVYVLLWLLLLTGGWWLAGTLLP